MLDFIASHSDLFTNTEENKEKDLKKKIAKIDINSKKKIILISLEIKNLKE